MTKKKSRSLDYAVKDGVAHSAMMGMGENYLSPYAIELGASDMQIGFLSSIPKLLGSLSQLFSSKITEKIGSRKTMVLLFGLFQSLIWIPIAFLAFSNFSVIWTLILLATVYWVSGSIIVPAWTSWIGDLVPEKTKGKFFGKRRTYTGLSFFISLSLAGLILYISDLYNPFIGFTIIFTIAFISKLISWIYLKRMEEPKFHVPEESKFSFIDFIKRMPRTNFGKFVIFLSLMTFSVNIASPYFSLYMLKHIGLDYLDYTIVSSTSNIINFIFIGIWGKYSDFFGNKRVMSLTGSFIFLIPILWSLSTSVVYLVFVQTISGFLWSGFNIATFNFIFDTVSPSKRVRAVSYYNVLNGIAIFIGTSLGGWLLTFQTPFWSSFILLLIVSSIGRFLAARIMLPRIKEVKWVQGRRDRKLLVGVMSEVFEGLKSPVIFLSNRRLIIKRRSEEVLNRLKKFIEKALGKRNKYE